MQELSAEGPAGRPAEVGRLARDGARRGKIDGNGAKARVGRKEKSIESVGEGIVVGAGFAVGGLGGNSFSLPQSYLAPGSP